MQNLLIMARINEPETTSLEKMGKRWPPLPGEAQATPALLSPAERTALFIWRALESRSPAQAGRCHGPELNVPQWEPCATIPQPQGQESTSCASCAPQGHGHHPKSRGSPWWQQHWAKHRWFKGMCETQRASITTCHPFYAFPTWEPIEKTPPL